MPTSVRLCTHLSVGPARMGNHPHASPSMIPLEGLQLRMLGRRWKHIALHRGPAPMPAGPQER